MNDKIKLFTYITERQKTLPVMDLCLKTWEKFLSDDFEIIVLDRHNYFDYLPNDLPIEEYELLKNCDFRFFFELVCCFVLFYNGGLFMEPTVLVTGCDDNLKELTAYYELSVFGRSKNLISAGFLMAKKFSCVLRDLLNRMITYFNIRGCSNISLTTVIEELFRDNHYAKTAVLEDEKYGYHMEKTLFGVTGEYIFQNCYFTNAISVSDFVENSHGFVYLNSSFVPETYFGMSESEFLSQDILLAKLFQKLL